MQLKRSVLTLALLTAFSAPLFAADHRDGPLATNDPTADLGDVYLFNNPNDASELILIGTVVPIANRNSRFSDAVEYNFFIDNGTSGGQQKIVCTFPSLATQVSCTNASGSLAVSGSVEVINTSGDVRVFAGLRDDPFFFDLAAFGRTRDTLTPSFTSPGVDFFGDLDTLAIVLGIKHAALTNNGANPILKAYSTTTRIGRDGLTPGFSGLWYDAANPGHGLVIEILDPPPSSEAKAGFEKAHLAYGQVMTYWAVFNNGAQLNMWGIGPIDKNTASVPVVTATGGLFPPAFNSSQVMTSAFGTLNFNFSNCNTGTMAVVPTQPGFNPVTINLTRLTSIRDSNCSLLTRGQIDRNGRPGVNTALIDLLASTGLKDAYNRASDPATWAPMFQQEMQNNITALDTLDGITGNTVAPPAALAGILVDDRLQINTSIAACDAYLAVELGVAGQCGGRTLARDVIDDTLGALVGPGVSDNVPNDSVFLTNFPFVGIPLR